MGKERPKEKPEPGSEPEREPEHEPVNPESGRREIDEWRGNVQEKLDNLESGQAGLLEKLGQLLSRGMVPDGDPENPGPNGSGNPKPDSGIPKPEPLDEWAGS